MNQPNGYSNSTSNGTSPDNVGTPVTTARFEIRIPRADNNRSSVGKPTTHRQPEAHRPSAPAPVTQQQQSRSATTTPTTRSAAATPASRQVEARAAASTQSPSTGRSLHPAVRSVNGVNGGRNQPHSPQSAVPPAVRTPASQPPELPRGTATSSSTRRQSHAPPTPTPQPVETPTAQASNAPRHTVETPTALRRPAPSTTPSSERPWKRAKPTLSEAEALDIRIRDFEYEMSVADAQLNLHSRQVARARANVKEEKAAMIQIQQYMKDEDEIVSRINEHSKLLTALVKLHVEFARTLSKDPSPRRVDLPTLSNTDADPPPTAFSNLIKSVSIYHDAFSDDLTAAKAEIGRAEIAFSNAKKECKEAERLVLEFKSGYDVKKRQLNEMKGKLEALKRQ